MLTEQFIASISVPIKANTGLTKDAGIFLHELQPLPAQRHLFKKSITAPHCLAVSPSHFFAAQEEKAVIHVYSREKGNQECLIPFQERIHCVECAGKDGEVLLIGCESGRVLIWEVRMFDILYCTSYKNRQMLIGVYVGVLRQISLNHNRPLTTRNLHRCFAKL